MINQKDDRHYASNCKLPQNPFHSKIYYFPFSLTNSFNCMVWPHETYLTNT